MLRVCLISPLPPPYGGIARWTELVLDYPWPSGIELTNINTAPARPSATVPSIGWRVATGSFQFLRQSLSVGRAMLRRPHVLHLNTSGGLALVRDLVILAAARAVGIPTTYQLHHGRTSETLAAPGMRRIFAKLTMKIATQIVTLDEQTAKAISDVVGRSDVAVLPNFYDSNSLPSVGPSTGGEAEKEPLKLLYLGWLMRSKGIEDLLDAWRLIPASLRSRWQLDLVGPCSPDYERHLKSTMPPRCTAKGELEHSRAMEELASCDLFVLPSHSEGFPNVILEAMGLERPIVATAVGAIPSMLADGAGLVIPPRSPDLLASALEQLMRDRSARKRLGGNALTRAEVKYDINVALDDLIQIWRSVGIAGGK